VLQTREHTPTPFSSTIFTSKLPFASLKEFGGTTNMNVQLFKIVKVFILELPLENPKKKYDLNVTPTNSHKIYYREGNGASSQRLQVV
jgi:hypothetical protein